MKISVPRGWTIRKNDDGTVAVVAPLDGPGGDIAIKNAGRLEQRLLHALACALVEHKPPKSAPEEWPKDDFKLDDKSIADRKVLAFAQYAVDCAASQNPMELHGALVRLRGALKDREKAHAAQTSPG